MKSRILQDIAEAFTRMMLLSATVAVLVLIGVALFFTRKGD